MNVVPENVHQNRIFTDPAADQRRSVHGVIDVIARRLQSVIFSVMVCLGVAGWYLVVTPDSYTATAVLMMDTKQTPPSPSQLSQEPLIDPAVIDSQIEILKSERIAQEVVDSLKLVDNPEFAGGGPGLRARAAAWITGTAAKQSPPEVRRIGAVDAFLHKVKVLRAGHSYLAEISATTLEPQLSARIANSVADAYIKDQLDSRLSANQRTVAWMSQRVRDVQEQATAADAALLRYRQDHASAVAAQDPAVLAKSNELSVSADAAKADFESLQTRSLRLAQFIQQQTMPITEARVLTSAEPPLSKSAPKSEVIILLASFGGLLIGAGVAVARETLDRKLRTPQQIRGVLGLPLAGMVQAVLADRQGPALATLFDAHRPWCAATETFRSLKVSVDNDLRRTGGIIIGIVSPWPGEGKSTLTKNLGRLLTEIGARVLVVDGDLKKPDLSVALGSTSERGLVDVIEGDAGMDECRVRTKDGFDLIGHGRGAIPLHPFDMLGSRRMQTALTSAQSSYDYILLDLPSLLTSVDSQAVARFVDAFVLVAEYGRTTIEDVDRALATSETIASRVIGVVLNKARGTQSTAQRHIKRRLYNRGSGIRS